MTSKPNVLKCLFCGHAIEPPESHAFPIPKCDKCLDKQQLHLKQEESIAVNNQRILELENIIQSLN